VTTVDVNAKLQVTGADGVARPLVEADLQHSDPAAGPGALEQTQSDALAQLVAAVTALNTLTAALADPATGVRQDAAKAVLDAINQAVGAPSTDTLLSLLETIAANTGTETTTVQQLELTADQIQLNTDAVENKLDTLHADLSGKVSVKQEGVAPPLGYDQLSIGAGAAGLGAIPNGAVTALVVPRAPVRWRDDGEAPTAAVGMYLAADTPLVYQGDLGALQLVAVAGQVEVNVSFYGAEA
jgi:hypothetical protein